MGEFVEQTAIRAFLGFVRSVVAVAMTDVCAGSGDREGDGRIGSGNFAALRVHDGYSDGLSVTSIVVEGSSVGREFHSNGFAGGLDVEATVRVSILV